MPLEYDAFITCRERVHEAPGVPGTWDERLASLAHDALESRGEAALRAFCDAAIERGVLPERLLIVLKQQWRRIALSRGMPPIEADHLLAGHVTRCIAAYYQPRRSELS